MFNLFPSIFFIIVLYILFINNHSRLRLWFGVKKYDAIQRSHLGDISRLGGFVSWLGFLFYFLIETNQTVLIFMKACLISSLPLVIICLKEDVFYSTKPITRLIACTLSALLFFFLFPINFPTIELPFIGNFLSSSNTLAFLFYLSAIIIFINGNNMIDGANGLMVITNVAQCIALLFICNQFNDTDNIIYIGLVMSLQLTFLIFNYPWGKIFMGDLGAFFFGFLISILTIKIFADHPTISSWAAPLILFYSSFEVLFSVIRKSLSKQNPLKADTKHLHLIIFHLMCKNTKNKLMANNLVAPLMIMIWGLPFVLFFFFWESHLFCFLSLIIMILIYLLTYYVFIKLTKFHDEE